MALINEHFLKLQNNYLFSDIAKKVNSFKVTHPKKKIIRMGIGDVTQPLAPAVIEAMHKAVDEMASKDTFHGYGPEQGYPFLIDAIIKNDYASRGIFLEPGEVFVSDGAKSDCGNIGDMLRHDNSIGVTDPVYPVYIDSNVMSGRTGTLENGKWSDVVYIPCTEANNFVPDLPSRRVDIIYLCYPNNPTGTTLTKEELKKWVNYALANDCLIMYDSAYEAYIQDPNIPHSIYEIKGSEEGGDRVPQLLQNSRFHRCALRLHDCSERVERLYPGRRTGSAEPDVEPPSVHEVQRYELHHPARSRSSLQPGRERAGPENDRLLHGQRPHHAGKPPELRPAGVWRRKRTLHLAENTGRTLFLEIL